MSNMDDKLIIDIARLDPDGETISGEVDAVDLDEEFVKPFGGIRYELDVKLYGKDIFMNVREKLSLCYYCRSMINQRSGIMIVSSGIESKNKDIAKR